jgi:hypothetical protein
MSNIRTKILSAHIAASVILGVAMPHYAFAGNHNWMTHDQRVTLWKERHSTDTPAGKKWHDHHFCPTGYHFKDGTNKPHKKIMKRLVVNDTNGTKHTEWRVNKAVCVKN